MAIQYRNRECLCSIGDTFLDPIRSFSGGDGDNMIDSNKLLPIEQRRDDTCPTRRIFRLEYTPHAPS
jgi:hypothetical protein